MVMLETVGLTKNPLQLKASASTKSTANAPARCSFPRFDRIAIHAPEMPFRLSLYDTIFAPPMM